MADKICPNCYQEWPDCVCVIPIRRRAGRRADVPRPHPVLSRQLVRVGAGPARPWPVPGPAPQGPVRIDRPGADYPKEFCPDCHRPWQGCGCAGRRI